MWTVCLSESDCVHVGPGGLGTVGGGQGVPGLAEVWGREQGKEREGPNHVRHWEQTRLAVRSTGCLLPIGPADWKPVIADRKQNCAWHPLWKGKLGQNPKMQRCLLNNHENSNEGVRMLITVDELVCSD